ncbi:FecR domain-containing protein [Bradyrhizobium sp. Arg237L]|uniref:FecR family protein n=1 Tax=Bradyrhizobium sp. Arg237L TaxID=3003352 RepID=UPI00249E50AB|nr:FecR domain-containing protein [Bradyrhizobium sp. Arg237L]MDI4236521.1 FecR domain-containing protein [Bradyrhizobium sp. Arg237L]
MAHPASRKSLSCESHQDRCPPIGGCDNEGHEARMSKGQARRTALSSIEDEAVDWVQKLISGEATPGEIEAAMQWRAQNPGHAAAYDAAERAWREMGALGRALLDPKEDYAAALDKMALRRRTVNRRAVLGGGATALAAAAVYGAINPPIGLWPSLTELAADYRTGAGEQRTVQLADDVAIELNTRTSLAVRETTAAEQRIQLIAGEASFTTRPQVGPSLVVLAASGRTISDGGRFDIRFTATGEHPPVTVTCFEGETRIEHRSDTVDLRPGQRVHYDQAGISQIGAVDLVLASEWRRGILEFRNAPLAEAVDEINRYWPGRVILMNGALAKKQLNGRFSIGQIEQVLLALEQAFNANVRRLPGGIVLLS